MKYLVMQKDRSGCVLLDEEGRFVRAADMGYEVGERIEDPILHREARPNLISRRALTVCAAAACLMLTFGGLWRVETAVTGSVYLSINPAVRMDVNRSERVVRVEGLNPDGAALSDGYSHAGKNVDKAAAELVDRAIDMGYLHPGGEIVIELSGEESWEQSAGQRMEQNLERHLIGRMQASVVLGGEPEPTPAQVASEPIVIGIPVAPALTPEPTPEPTPKPTPRPTATPRPDSGYSAASYGTTAGGSGYGSSGYGSSGYGGNSGYSYSSSGYGGGSGYDGGS